MSTAKYNIGTDTTFQSRRKIFFATNQEVLLSHRTRWATMADVAREAGVAPMTVSRALGGTGRVSSEKRERIMKAVRKLDFVPDAQAGGLSSKATKIVGAIVSTLAEPIFGRTIDGLSKELRREGYQLLVAATEYSRETEAESIRSILARRPDGLVLTESVHSEASRRMLVKSGIPVVEVWELPEASPYHAVGFSNRAAGAEAARHLFDRGCRNIGFIGNVRGSDLRVQQRLGGFRDILDARGVRSDRILETRSEDLSGVERGAHDMSRMLETWPEIDAVFCMNDMIAFGAMCEAERRGRVGGKMIGIVGFGALGIASEAGAGLTTIRCFGEEIGHRAGRVILEGVCGREDARHVVDTGFEIVVRRT